MTIMSRVWISLPTGYVLAPARLRGSGAQASLGIIPHVTQCDLDE